MYRAILSCFALVATLYSSLANGQTETGGKMVPFYIGTYTGPKSEGIYRSQLDTSSGMMSDPVLVAKLDNPSFLTIHPKLSVLYSVSEIRRDGQREGAQLMAYRIEGDGKLTSIGGQKTSGVGPCYVSTDQTGRYVLVANYASGSIACLPTNADGSLREPFGIQHEGKSVNPERQEGPHAHSIMTDPSNRFVCAVDLGLDQILVYELDHTSGKLTPRPDGNYRAVPGNGPRHLAFHPNGKHAFVNHEIASKLSSLSWKDGRFSEIDTASSLPDGVAVNNSTAEVLVHPNGNFVFVSNRGHDSIAAFRFDASSGKLISIGHRSTMGDTPRNFRLDPSGRFLLAANQSSGTIFAFRVDAATGALTQVGNSISVGGPCCIKFFVTK